MPNTEDSPGKGGSCKKVAIGVTLFLVLAVTAVGTYRYIKLDKARTAFASTMEKVVERAHGTFQYGEASIDLLSDSLTYTDILVETSGDQGFVLRLETSELTVQGISPDSDGGGHLDSLTAKGMTFTPSLNGQELVYTVTIDSSSSHDIRFLPSGTYMQGKTDIKGAHFSPMTWLKNNDELSSTLKDILEDAVALGLGDITIDMDVLTPRQSGVLHMSADTSIGIAKGKSLDYVFTLGLSGISCDSLLAMMDAWSKELDALEDPALEQQALMDFFSKRTPDFIETMSLTDASLTIRNNGALGLLMHNAATMPNNPFKGDPKEVFRHALATAPDLEPQLGLSVTQGKPSFKDNLEDMVLSDGFVTLTIAPKEPILLLQQTDGEIVPVVTEINPMALIGRLGITLGGSATQKAANQ